MNANARRKLGGKKDVLCINATIGPAQALSAQVKELLELIRDVEKFSSVEIQFSDWYKRYTTTFEVGLKNVSEPERKDLLLKTLSTAQLVTKITDCFKSEKSLFQARLEFFQIELGAETNFVKYSGDINKKMEEADPEGDGVPRDFYKSSVCTRRAGKVPARLETSGAPAPKVHNLRARYDPRSKGRFVRWNRQQATDSGARMCGIANGAIRAILKFSPLVSGETVVNDRLQEVTPPLKDLLEKCLALIKKLGSGAINVIEYRPIGGVITQQLAVLKTFVMNRGDSATCAGLIEAAGVLCTEGIVEFGNLQQCGKRLLGQHIQNR
ncbi:hypothetical protein Ciccas_009557 [Cichlidogyrus casuarinus]|uniref:Uncharacterized protein n=1 Tax=Cichlidogyrus casuarinus TaxID=1844966 RepID=A0ABD2Q165_9PLAT